MQGGKGVQFVFALPITAIGCIFGILSEPLIGATFITLAALTAAALIWLNIRPSLVGIFILAFCVGLLRASSIPATGHGNQATPPFSKIRYFLDSRLEKNMPPPQHALASGILFGGSARFTKEWKTVFRETGTSHIVAVSGANLVLLMQWLDFIIRRSALSRRRRFVICMVVLAGYAAMTGASASVVRAALMALLAEIAPLIGRRAHTVHLLAAAALIMVLFDPYVAADIGFQFSCLATLGIATATPEEPCTKLETAVGATIAALIFVLPLQLYYFHTMSFSALLANIAIAPFIPIIMCAAALHTVFGSVITALPVFAAASAVLGLLRWFSELPGSSGDVHISVWTLGVAYLVIVVYVCHRLYKSCILRSL
jgi:ComEC/Rec2-related protein